jgi:Helix-turn-helix domain
MPWKECSVMDERLRFVARLLDGEAMSAVCREFGISRKTGYKIFERYKEHGLEALSDRSRRPVRYANQLPSQIESLIVGCKRDKPPIGAPARSGSCWCAVSMATHPRAGQEHHPCSAASPRPGQAARPQEEPPHGHAALPGRRPSRLVRRWAWKH